MKFYLDTSAWVKRYLAEVGSPEVDLLFEKITSGSIKLVSSFWNIGECLGVFDKRMRRKELRRGEFKRVLQNFFSETTDLANRGSLELFPVSAELLLECWRLILVEHFYQADVLQIETSLTQGCDVFLTGDEELARIAGKHGLDVIVVEKSEDRMRLRKLIG